MKQTLIALLLINLVLSACTPAPAPTPTSAPSATSLPTATPSPTSTATPTATPAPILIAGPTYLFPGPDSFFARQATPLPAGTLVYPLGRYGDFVWGRIQVGDATQEGFVPATAFESLPTLSPLSDMTWTNRTEDIQARFAVSSCALYAPEGQEIVVDNSQNDWFNDSVPYLLEPTGAFQLSFQIQTSDGQYGSIKLADKPNRTDSALPWWQGIRRVDFVTENGRLYIHLRDGLAESSFHIIPLNRQDTHTLTVTFLDPQGKIFTVSDETGWSLEVDVRELDLYLPDGLFPEQTVYIGRVTSPHSVLHIRSFYLKNVPDGKFVSVEPTLRQLAEQGGISLAVMPIWWMMQDQRYYDLVVDNFNVLHLEEFGEQFWRGRGDYDFESVDRIVDWAVRHDFLVYGFHLVWGATEGPFLPDWLLQSNFSRDEYIDILHEHVTTVVSHFRGRVTGWSIANEATSRSAFPSSDFWMQKIGPEYIELSFQWAREADPDAILIFNDYNNESPRDANTRWVVNRMYETVRELKAKGVPIDAVGMQMHLLLKYSSPIPPERDDVIETMRRFGELGVRVYVTEFDVDVSRVPGSQQERWEYQANLYRNMLEACLVSGVCDTFMIFGVSDSTSWITCQEAQYGCVNVPNADPLMFDQNLNPKPAYYAVREVLLQHVQHVEIP
jgi:endo-1,4-beta-xylanase